jgi:hypothetical protein
MGVTTQKRSYLRCWHAIIWRLMVLHVKWGRASYVFIRPVLERVRCIGLPTRSNVPFNLHAIAQNDDTNVCIWDPLSARHGKARAVLRCSLEPVRTGDGNCGAFRMAALAPVRRTGANGVRWHTASVAKVTTGDDGETPPETCRHSGSSMT